MNMTLLICFTYREFIPSIWSSPRFDASQVMELIYNLDTGGIDDLWNLFSSECWQSVKTLLIWRSTYAIYLLQLRSYTSLPGTVWSHPLQTVILSDYTFDSRRQGWPTSIWR